MNKHQIGDLILLTYDRKRYKKTVYCLGIIIRIEENSQEYINSGTIKEKIYYLDWVYHGTNNHLLDGQPLKENDITEYKERLQKFKKDNNIS